MVVIVCCAWLRGIKNFANFGIIKYYVAIKNHAQLSVLLQLSILANFVNRRTKFSFFFFYQVTVWEVKQPWQPFFVTPT